MASTRSAGDVVTLDRAEVAVVTGVATLATVGKVASAIVIAIVDRTQRNVAIAHLAGVDLAVTALVGIGGRAQQATTFEIDLAATETILDHYRFWCWVVPANRVVTKEVTGERANGAVPGRERSRGPSVGSSRTKQARGSADPAVFGGTEHVHQVGRVPVASDLVLDRVATQVIELFRRVQDLSQPNGGRH
jgi:hypothetical protein